MGILLLIGLFADQPAKQKQHSALAHPGAVVHALASSARHIASIGSDGKVVILEAGTLKLAQTVEFAGNSRPGCIAFSTDQAVLFVSTAGARSRVGFWGGSLWSIEISSGNKSKIFDLEDNEKVISIWPGEKSFLVAKDSGGFGKLDTLVLREMSGKYIGAAKPFAFPATDVCSPRPIGVCWRIEQQLVLMNPLLKETSRIRIDDDTFSKSEIALYDAGYIAIATSYRTAVVYDVKNRKRVLSLSGEIDLVIRDVSNLYVAASEGPIVQVYDIRSGEVVSRALLRSDPTCCMLLPNGSLLVGDQSGRIHCLAVPGQERR